MAEKKDINNVKKDILPMLNQLQLSIIDYAPDKSIDHVVVETSARIGLKRLLPRSLEFMK